jgi:hypothetical protein
MAVTLSGDRAYSYFRDLSHLRETTTLKKIVRRVAHVLMHLVPLSG